MNEQIITTLVEAIHYENEKNYEDLTNKPKIEGIELIGDRTYEDLGLASAEDVAKKADSENSVLTGTTNAENVVVSGDLTSDSDASFKNVVVSGEIDVPTPTSDNQAATKKYVDENSTLDYEELSNKPKIEGVELADDKSFADLGLEANNASAVTAKITRLKIGAANYSLAGVSALTFQDYSAMITDLNARASGDLEVGSNIYIATLNVPDLWIQANAEETSAPYTYTTDAKFVEDLTTAGVAGLQIGFVRVNKLETEQVLVPVQDVQVDGVSVLDGGVAKVPKATSSKLGVGTAETWTFTLADGTTTTKNILKV